jgi:hypothetical protein
LAESYDPVSYAIERPESGLDLARAADTWKQLDRPERLPPVPPPEPKETSLAAGPTWRLLMANVDPLDPALGSAIASDEHGRQLVLKAGEVVAERAEYRVRGIAISGAGDAREAVATLEGPAGQVLRLSLRRDTVPTAN